MIHITTLQLQSVLKITRLLIFQLTFIAGILILTSTANAVVTITKAGNGTGISADNAANATAPAYTLLGDIVLTEGLTTDFAIGTNVTFNINAPSGWVFNTAAAMTATASAGNDITGVSIINVTTFLVSVQLTVNSNTNLDILTVSGIQVMANEGGNISAPVNLTKGGSVVITGCVSGANLGSLSLTAGTMSKLVVTLPGQTFSDASSAATSGNSGTPTTQTAGVSFLITKIRATDQFFNVVPGFSGLKTLTYSGPGSSGTPPSYVTNVSFAGGVSSTALTTTLRMVETTTISVTDGTISGPASSPVTVIGGPMTHFMVEAFGGGNIGTQVAGISFNLRITARDAGNNICSSGPYSFNGNANITSTGMLSSGNGLTASFVNGVLASHAVAVSNQGSFTITATRNGGTETGTSNSFQVNYPPLTITAINPSCITSGSGSFVITVDGANYTGTSVVQFNGSSRATTFVNSTRLTAIILAADIAAPGVYSITVFTPGVGTTAAIILNRNTSSTTNPSICQGSTHILPDGTPVTTAGSYISHIANATGCDSAITTNLVVNSGPTRLQNVTICPGTSYILPDGISQSLPGTYYSAVPNPPGCDSIITTILANYASPVISATPVQIACFGGTGSVALDANNGLPPYVYGPTPTTNLTAGTYNYMVTDANGCTDNTSATIQPAPAQLLLVATPTQIACSGGTGSMNLNASGGTPGYTYNGTPTTNLAPGTYNYQVTDNQGCTAIDGATIYAGPAPLTAFASVAPTPCGSSTGSATANVAGGVPPYSYSWNTTPVSNTRSITGLSSGPYMVIVTDNNGCTTTHTANILNSNAPLFNISGITGICPGGNTTLCAPSGFTSYAWSTGATTSCITVNSADSISVTVTNASGCSSTKSVITTISSFPVCTITGGTMCLNSPLILRAPTGYANYLWNNGTKTSYNVVRSPGTYSVTVTNGSNCSSTCSYTVNSPMRIMASKVDGKCANEFYGSATVSASSGVPPYSYSWNTGDTTQTISRLSAGYYTARVVDSGGCALAYTISVFENKTTYDYSSISTGFNNNIIGAGSYIWFSAVASIDYTGPDDDTIRFINQNINGSGINLIPVNAKLIITNSVSQATTTYTGNEWVTIAPPNLNGNYFVSGYALPVTSPIAANLNTLKWRGIWTSSSSCVSGVHWKWSAATYAVLHANPAMISVKPVDDPSGSIFSNSDFAGTPENFKPFCIPGALSLGGTDYTGAYTTTLNRLPCTVPESCSSITRFGKSVSSEMSSDFILNVYPNPFSNSTNLEFVRLEGSGKVAIDIYSSFGKKVKTIFDYEVDAGVMYTVEFDAGDLPNGIYTYRLYSGNDEVRGKLILQR